MTALDHSQTEPYCSAPWSGITVMPNGDVQTCCVGTKILGNLYHKNIQDILHSETGQKIRDTTLHGKDKNCSYCVDEELQSGHANLRQHYLKFYPLKKPIEINIQTIDVRWNNKCNLSCQYCGPEASSTWEKLLDVPVQKARKDYDENLLSWMIDNAPNLREIMLAGGEPMLMKQNHDLINHLPPSVKINIVTNLNYDLQSLPCIQSLLDRPRDNTVWTISADNIGSRYEYVRQGASWALLEKNAQFIAKNWPNIATVNIVYSLFSAYDILDTFKVFNQIGINKVTLLDIHAQDEINVFHMPDNIRQKCRQYLEDLADYHQPRWGEDSDLFPIQGLSSMIHSLQQNQDLANQIPISKTEFRNKIAWYDQWSECTKFADLWPEV